MIIFPSDPDGIFTVHKPERLQAILLGKNLEEIILEVFFEIETQIPNRKTVGQPYLDRATPLYLSCKNNPALAQAMQTIQAAIAAERYKQIMSPLGSMDELGAEILAPNDS